MLKSLTELFTSTLNVFSDERRRHFSSQYQEKQKALHDAQNAFAPDYNRDRIALAEESLERFLMAYAKEFDAELSKKLISNV